MVEAVNTSLSLKVFAAFIFTIFHLADSFYIAAPSNVSVFNKTSTSLLICWEAVANDTIFGYRIRHRLNSTSPFHVNATTDATSNSSHGNKSFYEKNSCLFVCENRTSALLTDLQVYTYYWVEVIAFTNETFGNKSISKVFRTDEGVPTSPPLNVTETNKTSTSITLSWDAVPTQHRRGEIIGYLVTVVEHGGENEEQHNTTNRTLNIIGLKKFTFYNITVSARTSKGISNASTVFRIQTAEDAPEDPPIDITATVVSQPNITSDYIIIKWEPVEGRLNGKLRAYNIRWGPARGNASYTKERRINVTSSQSRRRRRRTANKVDSNERAFTLKDLRFYTNYSVQVAAITVKEGIYSDPVYFLSQEGVPSLPPGNVTAFNTSSTTITVMWSPPSRSVQGVLLGYEITYTPAWKNASASRRVMLCKRNTSFHLERLLKYTLYNITVAAFTKVGIGRESGIEQTWTDEDIPDAAPENVTAVSKTFSSIDVSWEPVPKAKQNGIITKYEVEVWKEVSGEWYYHANISTENLSVVVQNLTMLVEYGIAVRAYTSKGPGNYSHPPKKLMTLETAPSVVPFNLTGHAITGTSVNVKWQIQDLEPWFKLRQYVVKYRKLEHGGNYKTFNTSSNETHATLKNLSFFTMYEIKVAAVTKITGKFSEPANVTTKEGAPQVAPVNVTAVPETISSIRVSWKPVPKEERNGKITKYNVKVRNTSSEEVLRNVSVSAGNVTVVIEHLKMYVTYRFQVQAFTQEGPGPFSEPPVNGTTKQTAPKTIPENVTAKATGNSTIQVKWSLTGTSSITGFRGFIVQYKVDEHSKWQEQKLPGSIKKTNLTELRMFTRYRIQVAARTTQNGKYSEPVFAKTLEGVPTKPPDNIDATILETFVKISWAEVPEESRNGEILGYRITYYQADNKTYQRSETKPHDFFSIHLKSLGKFSKYHIKILAYTRAGDGKVGNISFKTSDDIPSRPPRNLTAISKISPHKIQVTWEPVPREFRNGNLLGYLVTYQRVMVGGVPKDYEPELQKRVSAAQNVTLDNLEPYSKYKIRVAAKTAKGLGPYTAFTYGETCHCLGRLTTSWRRYAPYVNFTEDGKPGQIIPLVLQSMVKECCGDCRNPNQTVLDFGTNGRNEPSNKNSSRKLLEGMDELTDFTFPVYGHKDQDSYKGGFGYTPVIESAGVAFIVHPEVSKTQTTLFQSMLNCLPVFILPIVTAYIAGVIIWCLERRNNPDDFPQSFLQGTWEGIWWSFVSMTTLGYGDRAPLSYKGRVFAIAWILFGLIVIAITMAMLTTALTVVTVDSEIKLYGSKIAAEYNSPEYNLGTRRNAKHDPDKDYHSIEEVADALVKRKVEGVLVDTYAAGLKSDLFDHPLVRVSSVLDYKTAYGIVLSPNSTRLGKCFKRYMLSHRAEIFRMIKTKVKPIESSDKQAQEESSGGLLDSGSPTFNKALRYACVMLGIALLFSLIYECIRRMRARQKVQQEVYFKTILLREMRSLVEEFICRIKQSKAKLGEKHRKQIVRFWKLKRKSMCGSGNESEWLRISTASPHRGDVTITDL